MNSFKNILVPVDFSENTELAVEKAMTLLDSRGGILHLLHVSKQKTVSKGFGLTSHMQQETVGNLSVALADELQLWKENIELVRPQTLVLTHLVRGRSVEKAIVSEAKLIHPDLIVIGKTSSHSWLPFRRKIAAMDLARKAGFAVLVVKGGARDIQIKTIVMPVRTFVPRAKLEILGPLLQRQNVRIYLLSLLSESSVQDEVSTSHSLIETFKILRNGINCQIANRLVFGNQFARVILEFAQSVNADVLVLNPEEARLSRITGLDLSDLLHNDSKLQIIAVEARKMDKSEI